MTTKLPNTIADDIRTMIVRGILSPGEHLRQVQLADRLNVSRVPIREALKLLAAEGIIVHDPNCGYEVSRLSLDEARQLYRLRRWTEAELLGNATWPDPRQLAEIEGHFAAAQDRLARRDRAGWREGLARARLAILTLSPSKALLREAIRHHALTDRYRAMQPLPNGTGDNSEHLEQAMLAALRARDRAALLAAYHLERDGIEHTLFAILESHAA